MSREKHPLADSDEAMVPEGGEAQGPSPTAEGDQAQEPEVHPAEAQLAEVQEKLLRALADGENLRRQSQRNQEDARRFAIADFALDLLATADTLELALKNVSDAQRTDPALSPLVEGVEATRRMLQAAFSKHGLSRSDPLGEPFDPNLHEAGFRMRGTGDPPDRVTEVVRPGYALNGRVLRPALVGVSSADAGGDGKP